MLENSPQQQKPSDSDHSSSDYYENFDDDLSDSYSWSEDEVVMSFWLHFMRISFLYVVPEPFNLVSYPLLILTSGKNHFSLSELWHRRNVICRTVLRCISTGTSI